MSIFLKRSFSSNLIEEIKVQGDKMMNTALFLYFGFGIVIATVYSTYLVAFGVGSLCLSAYYSTKLLLPKSNLYQYVASSVVAVFTAQFIYQMHGLFEMHFFVFVGSTLLIVYQNWRLQLPNIIIVVIHHAVFAYLQYSGMNIYFTQLNYMDFQTFVIHGVLAALVVFNCGYWGYILEKRTKRDTKNTKTLERQLDNISKNIVFAEAISQGDLSTDYQLSDEEDELGKALVKMREYLVEANDKNETEKFTTNGLAKSAEITQKHSQNLTLMADEVLKFMVKYINANQAALYIVKKEEGNVELQMVACYAYERKKYINKAILPGEGLVGQCYLEKEAIYLTDIPEEYIKITSGLGESRPKNLMVVPMKSNEEVVAILEIASFHFFNDKITTFLNKVSENIAGTISTTQITERTKDLLDMSNQQAEMMQAQEEEMRQNLEELQATQEEIQRRARDYELLIIEKDEEIKVLKQKMMATMK